MGSIDGIFINWVSVIKSNLGKNIECGNNPLGLESEMYFKETQVGALLGLTPIHFCQNA
jgi:hypothetical protein